MHFRRALPAEYRHVDPRAARIILVEAGPRALATFSEDIENDGKLLPGVTQVALQSGKHAAHVIRARVMRQQPPGPFAYFDKGNMATIS